MTGKRLVLWTCLALWLAAAIAISATGRLTQLRFPQPQIVVAALSALLLLAIWLVPSLRRSVESTSVREMVALHLSRFVGIAFLYLASRGLSPEFALKAGWGDITVATTALLLLLTTNPGGNLGRRLYLGWNLLGWIDIVFVVIMAARIGIADPVALAPLLRLPLSLLPTFLVPLIIVTHLIIFRRLLVRPGPGDLTASAL